MARVYSTRFIAGHAGAGGTYTVLPGFLAVVRCVTAFNASAIINEIAEVALGSSATTFYQKDLAQQVCDITELRVVVPAGDSIVAASGADVDVTVSGYLLSLP